MNEPPLHWLPGQLLNLIKFTDGTARATLLGEEWHDKLPITQPDWEAQNALHFSSLTDAQSFVSLWYSPASLRERVMN